jgi:hypothetical protein
LSALKADDSLKEVPVLVVSIVAHEDRPGLEAATERIEKPASRDQLARAIWNALPTPASRLVILDPTGGIARDFAEHTNEPIQIRTAPTAEQAEALMSRFQPDTVLVELRGRAQDQGWAFLSKLKVRTRGPALTIVVVIDGESSFFGGSQLPPQSVVIAPTRDQSVGRLFHELMAWLVQRKAAAAIEAAGPAPSRL